MNRILTLGLVALSTVAFTQPIYAGSKHGGGGKAHSGGGGKSHGGGGGNKAHFAGGGGGKSHGGGGGNKAHFAGGGGGKSHSSGRTFHAPSAPHFNAHARPKFNNPGAFAQSHPKGTHTPFVPQTRSFRHHQGIAFGGRTFDSKNNDANNARNQRNFSATSSRGGHGNNFAFQPPSDVSGNWDRGHTHNWNHHRYRWSGGDWVIIDGGFGYPYGNYYGYEEPYFSYSSPRYSYDYLSADSLTASVQDRLARLGYSPGPVDGVMGAQTRDALAAFQNDRNLPVTGQIDTSTLGALGL